MVQTRGRSSTPVVANAVDLPSPVEASHQVPRATPPLTIVPPPEGPSSIAPPHSTIAPVDGSVGASPSPFASLPPEILTEDATPTILLPTLRPPRPSFSSPIPTTALPTRFTPVSSVLYGFPSLPPVAPMASPSFPPGFGFFDTP
uniref:Uncharacterized protein n=1 Tax=Cannabis sativa TaxID=3483 RepID=A0A803NP34_CANSA